MNLKNATIYKRGAAFIIDELIISLLRILIMSIIYIVIWRSEIINIKDKMLAIISELSSSPNIHDVRFAIEESGIITQLIIFFLIFFAVGFAYQIASYHIMDGQTFGKKAIKLIMLTKDKKKPSLAIVLSKVMWSYMPWILPFFAYQLYANDINAYIPVIAVWLFWYDPWIIHGKKNVTLHDFLSGTIVLDMKQAKSKDEKNSN